MVLISRIRNLIHSDVSIISDKQHLRYDSIMSKTLVNAPFTFSFAKALMAATISWVVLFGVIFASPVNANALTPPTLDQYLGQDYIQVSPSDLSVRWNNDLADNVAVNLQAQKWSQSQNNWVNVVKQTGVSNVTLWRDWQYNTAGDAKINALVSFDTPSLESADEPIIVRIRLSYNSTSPLGEVQVTDWVQRQLPTVEEHEALKPSNISVEMLTNGLKVTPVFAASTSPVNISCSDYSVLNFSVTTDAGHCVVPSQNVSSGDYLNLGQYASGAFFPAVRIPQVSVGALYHLEGSFIGAIKSIAWTPNTQPATLSNLVFDKDKNELTWDREEKSWLPNAPTSIEVECRSGANNWNSYYLGSAQVKYWDNTIKFPNENYYCSTDGWIQHRITINSPKGNISVLSDITCLADTCTLPTISMDKPHIASYVTGKNLTIQPGNYSASPEYFYDSISGIDWATCPISITRGDECWSSKSFSKGTSALFNELTIKVPKDSKGAPREFRLFTRAKSPTLNSSWTQQSITKMTAKNFKITKEQRWNYLYFQAPFLSMMGNDDLKMKHTVYRNKKVVETGYGDGVSISKPKSGSYTSTFTACGFLNCVTASSQSAKYPMAKPKLKKVSVEWPGDNDSSTLVVRVELLSQYDETIKGSGSAVLQWRPGRSGRWITLDKVSLRSGKGTLVDILSSNGFYRVTYKGKSYYRSYY